MGIFVTPLGELDTNESVKIQVTASTSVPYQKTISCEFTLNAATQGANTYSVEDESNRDYAILKLTCPGDSTTVTLEFDPTQLRIDSNDEVYINRDTTTGSTETISIDGKQYVKKFIFEMPAETTKYVKFYKVDKTKDYTYPGFAGEHPIKVTI